MWPLGYLMREFHLVDGIECFWTALTVLNATLSVGSHCIVEKSKICLFMTWRTEVKCCRGCCKSDNVINRQNNMLCFGARHCRDCCRQS